LCDFKLVGEQALVHFLSNKDTLFWNSLEFKVQCFVELVEVTLREHILTEHYAFKYVYLIQHINS